MAILYGFVARCLFTVTFRHKAKQGRRLCAVATQKHLPHQRTAHWFTMRAQNRLGMVGLLSLPLVMGIAMWEIGSGQSDVHSGKSMSTCCVVNANMDSGEPGSQYCMTKHGSSYPQIVYWLLVSGVWNYPIGLAYLRCSRSPRNRLHKQRAAKPYKMAMNWAQVTQKKQQQTQVHVTKYNLFLYSCLYFYVLTTILNSHAKSLNRS